jgi:hypothetical protein
LTQLVVDGLHARGIASTAISTWYPLGFFVKSERGDFCGRYRRHAAGTRSLLSAEVYAVEVGCFVLTLETSSFQARPFYEKLEYQAFAALEDYPPGHTKFYVRKQLAAKPVFG